jgi:hypothetical protein
VNQKQSDRHRAMDEIDAGIRFAIRGATIATVIVLVTLIAIAADTLR